MVDRVNGFSHSEVTQPYSGEVRSRLRGARPVTAMELMREPAEATSAGGPAPQIEIVIPVRNEERSLARSVRSLVAYLRAELPFRVRVTIADNGSSDGTWGVAEGLVAGLAEVRAVRLEQAGKGHAIRSCWLESDAEVLAFMDVDLSSGLNALLPLVAPLLSGHSDVAIGTRLARGSRVSRGSWREVISRSYNLLLHALLDAGFSDAQCGFKAIRADKARQLLPFTEDAGFFFDTELLVLAERAGLRVHEVPVDWIDDPESSVDVLATALANLRGVARLSWRMACGELPLCVDGGWMEEPRAACGLPGQLLRFSGIGVASTLVYVLLYWMLRGALNAQLANALTLLVIAVGSTAVNRRITFGIRGRRHAARHQLQGLIAFAAGLVLTSAALMVLRAADARPGRIVEVAVLLAAGLLATVIRFVLYRIWIFRPRQAPPAQDVTAGARPEHDSLCRLPVPGETQAAAIGRTSASGIQPES